MNRTKIEWCDYTWNPATGCLNGCWYCYGAKIANRFGQDYNKSNSRIHELAYYDGTVIDLKTECRGSMALDCLPVGTESHFPFKFEPTMHLYRVLEPVDLKKGSKVFVCSMADLFGDWVPAEWIDLILGTVKEAPQHTYIFLTKNPNRYLWFKFPKNCWLGATLTGKEEIKEICYISNIFRQIGNIKFICYEPLLAQPLIFPGHIDWVIVGGLTPKPRHETKWVRKILDAYRLFNIPIFLKNNLKWHEELKEYPER